MSVKYSRWLRQVVIVALCLILFGIPAIDGVDTDEKTTSCLCNCKGSPIEMVVLESEYGECPRLCGKSCGGFTDCGKGGESCGPCCLNYCQNAGIPYEGMDLCREACGEACSMNGTLYGLIDLARMIAIATAAVMLAFLGLKFLTSEDLESRQEAKKYMMYVIAALVLLGIATELVDLADFGAYGTNQGVYEDKSEPYESGGGKILGVTQEVYKTRIELSVEFKNDGQAKGEFRIYMYDQAGNELDVEPDTYWKDVNAGETSIISITKALDFGSVTKYTLKLKEEEGEEVRNTYEHEFIGAMDEAVEAVGNAVMNCYAKCRGSEKDVKCAVLSTSGWEDGLRIESTTLESYLMSNYPDVLETPATWPAVTKFTDDTLKKEFGGICITYDENMNRVHFMDDSNSECAGESFSYCGG